MAAVALTVLDEDSYCEEEGIAIATEFSKWICEPRLLPASTRSSLRSHSKAISFATTDSISSPKNGTIRYSLA